MEPTVLTPVELSKQLKSFQGDMQNEVKKLLAEGASETGEMVTTLKGQITNMQLYVDNAIAQIKQFEASRIPGLAGSPEAKKFDFGALVKHARAVAGGSGYAQTEKEAAHELSIIAEGMKTRDASATDGAAGGYLIPQEIADDVITLAIARTPIMNLGTTVIKNLTADLGINKVTGRPAGWWVGENSAPTKEDTTFGQAWLRPKKAAAFSKVSNRLIYQSKGVADQIIRREISTAMGLQVNQGITSGIGGQYQPKGILNQSGFTATTVVCQNSAGTTTNGGRFRATDAAEMEMDLDVANELFDGGKYAYLFRPEVKSGMKRERVTMYNGAAADTGLPVDIMNPLMSDKQLKEYLGYEFATTTQITKNLTKGSSSTLSSVVFGNWEYFYVGMWRDFVMKVSEHASDAGGRSAFTEDQLYIVCFQECDCEVVRPTAFTKCVDAETLKANW